MPALVAFCGVFGLGIAAWPYTVDDAYIVGRYARHLAEGQGYSFAYGQTSDGVTGPLWLVVGVVASLLRQDPVAIAKGVGLLCAALGAALLVARASSRNENSFAGWVACVLVVASPTLGVWGQAGLETGAATLCVALAVCFADMRPQSRVHGLGVCVAALAWLRPEILPAALLLATLTFARVEKCERIALVAWCVLGIASVLLFRTLLFGTPMPLSFFAKPGELGAGAGYVLRAFVVHTTLAGAVLVSLSKERGLAFVLFVHLVAVVLAGGDWMPGYRLIAPVLPLFAFVASDGAMQLVQSGKRVLAGALVVTALILPTLDIVVELPLARDAGRARETTGRELASYLRDHAHRVALVDVGNLVYESDLDVVDLGGVTNAEVARAPGSYLDKRIRESWLRAQRADTLVLHSMTEPSISEDGRILAMRGYGVEQRIASMPFVRDEFRVRRVFAYAPNYYYIVLSGRSPQ